MSVMVFTSNGSCHDGKMRWLALVSALFMAFPASADLGDWLRDKLKSTSAPPDTQAAAGAIKDALRQGTERAVRELGR